MRDYDEFEYEDEIDFDGGNFTVPFKDKEYSVYGIINTVEYLCVKIDENGIRWVEKSDLLKITSDELTLVDEDDNEIVITDKEEIAEILKNERIRKNVTFSEYCIV